MFTAFLGDTAVGELVGVEGGGNGESTMHRRNVVLRHARGVLHGARTYLLQDSTGQIRDECSLAANLSYPGANSELLAMLKDARGTCASLRGERCRRVRGFPDAGRV